MGIKSIFKEVKRISQDIVDPTGTLKDMNPFKKPDSLGSPTAVQDPNAILEQEAENSAIAGDIAARNARQRSSTIGAGSRFLDQQKPKVKAAQKTINYSPHTNTNRLLPGAGSNFLSGGA